MVCVDDGLGSLVADTKGVFQLIDPDGFDRHFALQLFHKTRWPGMQNVTYKTDEGLRGQKDLELRVFRKVAHEGGKDCLLRGAKPLFGARGGSD